MAPNYFKDVPVAGLSGYARLEELINQHKAEMDEKIACQHEYLSRLASFLEVNFPDATYLAGYRRAYEERRSVIYDKFGDSN